MNVFDYFIHKSTKQRWVHVILSSNLYAGRNRKVNQLIFGSVQKEGPLAVTLTEHLPAIIDFQQAVSHIYSEAYAH
jgi:hypothetical protein